ncbi:MAG TPA: methyltransferase domain-containing protein [Candidatus Acidoferrum sp.]|nr:methyltransferase domain-containing protein [Candidatus Acidoferrum sp.]
MPRDWNALYADPQYSAAPPDPLLIELAEGLAPGRALDLACGTGRHALYLARLGWRVTAVDAAPAAIDRLRREAPGIDAQVADLERGEYTIEPASFDLICDFLYLQRDLFAAIREGVRPGGVFAGAINLHSSFALDSGELRDEFMGWKIPYYSESGGVARIIARRA